MAKYRLTRPTTIGSTQYAAGATVELPDHVPPFASWVPLCDAARAALAKYEKPFAIARNGVQAVDRATGRVRITHFGEKVPRPAQPKPGAKTAAAPSPDPKRTPQSTAAQFVAERQQAFTGEEHNQLLGAQALTRDVVELLEHRTPTAADHVAERQREFAATEADVARAKAAADAAKKAATPPPKTKRGTFAYRGS
jgi:hypothetical protein